jgi:hypothetical protein
LGRTVATTGRNRGILNPTVATTLHRDGLGGRSGKGRTNRNKCRKPGNKKNSVFHFQILQFKRGKPEIQRPYLRHATHMPFFICAYPTSTVFMPLLA